jgi:hypothetical protein
MSSDYAELDEALGADRKVVAATALKAVRQPINKDY